jgi:hypothetical protein
MIPIGDHHILCAVREQINCPESLNPNSGRVMETISVGVFSMKFVIPEK